MEGSKIRIMKKIYIKPEIEVFEVNHIDIIANSLNFYREGPVIGEDEEELGRDDSWRHGNNNAWDQGW